MHRTIATCLLLALAMPANAEECPQSYRFVDFGSEGPDGVIRRGGTIFRAFLPDGTRLLNLADSVCLPVEEVARDGRALPIPVVSQIGIDPQIAGLDLLTLRLSVAEDTAMTADESAMAHREKLAQADTVVTRGDDFLCASTPDDRDLSCQVLSPYSGTSAPVVYCDGQTCEVPAMGRDAQIVIRATWPQTVHTPEAAGPDILRKLQVVHDFLEGQI